MENKKTAVLFFGAAVLSYISAAINFFGSDTSTGTLFLCLGSALLCLGATCYLKSNQDRKNIENQNNDNQE